MSGAVATGIVYGAVASAAIGAASAAYQGKKQEKAANADRDRRTAEANAAKAESDRIARETRPDEEALGETAFGAEDALQGSGSSQDFLVPKTSALGGASNGRSGLGFSV